MAFWAVFLTATGALLLVRPWALAFAFYARLEQSAVEHHPRRAAVLSIIRGSPGANTAELGRATGVAGGVLRHHLQQLRVHGLVRSVRAGRSTHWFPATGRPVQVPPTSAQRRILLLLQQKPGAPTREIAAALGLSFQNVWKQLQRMGRANIVAKNQAGHVTVWSAVA